MKGGAGANPEKTTLSLTERARLASLGLGGSSHGSEEAEAQIAKQRKAALMEKAAKMAKKVNFHFSIERTCMLLPILSFFNPFM